MMEPRPRKRLDQVRYAVRVKHYSYSTEKTYVYWIRRFIFHNKRHPQEMGTAKVTVFLTHLEVTERVAASTQCQDKDDLHPRSQSWRTRGAEFAWLVKI